ncbi:hypothetical protein GGR56DRAFT_502701 [Xylariaceae sp. FL0804]|nr:hypothetical protein GGR56DRAFT_502701 [Xylariaceae sp. FL0804]
MEPGCIRNRWSSLAALSLPAWGLACTAQVGSGVGEALSPTRSAKDRPPERLAACLVPQSRHTQYIIVGPRVLGRYDTAEETLLGKGGSVGMDERVCVAVRRGRLRCFGCAFLGRQPSRRRHARDRHPDYRCCVVIIIFSM